MKKQKYSPYVLKQIELLKIAEKIRKHCVDESGKVDKYAVHTTLDRLKALFSYRFMGGTFDGKMNYDKDN